MIFGVPEVAHWANSTSGDIGAAECLPGRYFTLQCGDGLGRVLHTMRDLVSSTASN
jgi:hypothetical protein